MLRRGRFAPARHMSRAPGVWRRGGDSEEPGHHRGAFLWHCHRPDQEQPSARARFRPHRRISGEQIAAPPLPDHSTSLDAHSLSSSGQDDGLRCFGGASEGLWARIVLVTLADCTMILAIQTLSSKYHSFILSIESEAHFFHSSWSS